MYPENERICSLILSSIEEVDKIIGKDKKKKRLKTGFEFFLSIKETLTNLKNKFDSKENIDTSLVLQVEKMVSASARVIEDTLLFEKLNKISERLADFNTSESSLLKN